MFLQHFLIDENSEQVL